MLLDKEKKRRQHEKELKSLRNKMGKSIIWFDALNKTQQYEKYQIITRITVLFLRDRRLFEGLQCG